MVLQLVKHHLTILLGITMSQQMVFRVFPLAGHHQITMLSTIIFQQITSMG